MSDAIEQGFAVIAAPGPSAALAALCVAGLPTDRFYFEGFLPSRSSARRERINALAAVPGSLIFYEAAGRLAETLADLAVELGPRPAAVARELTKVHEEVRRGALDKLAAEYEASGPPRGEIVIVVGPLEARAAVSEAVLDQEITEQLANLSVKDAAATVAAKHGLPRRQVYARALALAGAQHDEGPRRTADRAPAQRASLRPQSRDRSRRCFCVLKGYTILERRFVVSGGEIDLVARRGGSIAFVEVKARADLEVAAIAISATKRRRISRAARVWLSRKPMGRGPDAAGRRRLRRAGPTSPARAGRV